MATRVCSEVPRVGSVGEEGEVGGGELWIVMGETALDFCDEGGSEQPCCLGIVKDRGKEENVVDELPVGNQEVFFKMIEVWEDGTRGIRIAQEARNVDVAKDSCSHGSGGALRGQHSTFVAGKDVSDCSRATHNVVVTKN